jgi:type VI secretion system protein ImpF
MMPIDDSINDASDPGARIWARDRLQPTLLDRLTDHHPERASDTAAELVISRRQLRHIIMRDLGWLLNATQMESDVDFTFYPHAQQSTINFGLPALSGRRTNEVKLDELENEIRQTIIRFEPRIIASTLEVIGMSMDDEADASAHNLITFGIRGQIWAIPYPIEMLLKSSIDLENGAITLQDQLGNS